MAGLTLEQRGIFPDEVMDSYHKEVERYGNEIFGEVLSESNALALLNWLAKISIKHHSDWGGADIIAETVRKAGIYKLDYMGGDYVNQSRNLRFAISQLNKELDNSGLHLMFDNYSTGSTHPPQLPAYRLISRC